MVGAQEDWEVKVLELARKNSGIYVECYVVITTEKDFMSLYSPSLQLENACVIFPSASFPLFTRSFLHQSQHRTHVPSHKAPIANLRTVCNSALKALVQSNCYFAIMFLLNFQSQTDPVANPSIFPSTPHLMRTAQYSRPSTTSRHRLTAFKSNMQYHPKSLHLCPSACTISLKAPNIGISYHKTRATCTQCLIVPFRAEL